MAKNIVTNFIFPPYFSGPETDSFALAKRMCVDFLYDYLPDTVFNEVVQCMNNPSNEKISAYFDLLENSISRSTEDFTEELIESVIESKDDFRIMIDQEGKEAYRRFLPLPDIGKHGMEIWMLPNFASFTNIYARINRYLSGRLDGCRIIHDKQDHFDEIIRNAKSELERIGDDVTFWRSSNCDFNIQQIAELSFGDSKKSIGIQIADMIAGISMRWYQAQMQEDSKISILDKAIGMLLDCSDKGTGINIVGPQRIADRLLMLSRLDLSRNV